MTPSILWLDTVDSTQRVASELVVQDDRHYEVVCAHHQTMGRGRKGAHWYDEPDTSLLTSIILWDESPPEPVGLVGMVGAMAVAEVVSDFLHAFGHSTTSIRLKYPNDVLWEGRKLAGVLVEIVQQVPIVGIGINIAQTRFPPDLEHKAISVYQAVGAPTPEQFRNQHADWVARLYTTFKQWLSIARTSPDLFHRRWCGLDSSAGHVYRVLGQPEELYGVALGIKPDFRLRLRLENNQEINTYYVESLESG